MTDIDVYIRRLAEAPAPPKFEPKWRHRVWWKLFRFCRFISKKFSRWERVCWLNASPWND